MDRIPKWFSSRSRKKVAPSATVAQSATVTPSRKVATQSVYRQIMRTMSRSGKVAPDEGTVIKQKQKEENGMPIVEEETFSPFEVRISSSRNQMSNNSPNRYQMPNQSEISRMRETLRFLDKNSPTIPKPIIDKHPTILNPTILNHTLLIELLNEKQFDLSGITEINLNRSDDDLHHIFKFKIDIIQLLTFTLHTSDKIDTIIIDYIDYLIPVLLVLKSYPQKLQTIKKLILKSKCGTPKPITDEVIFDLLNMIEKMNALKELEFSNFEMDVSKFKSGFTLMDLFRGVAMLKNLKHITFDCNSFTDSETEKKYNDFHKKYFGIRDNLERISLLVEWMIQNPEQNIDSSGAYKAYIYSIFWNNYSKQKEKAERTQIPTDYNERKIFVQERRINLPKISDVDFKVFLNDKEAVKVWLKWLILNKAEYIEYRETKIEGDIVERLRIVIEYFKYNKESIIRFFEKNPTLQEVIISEFSKIWRIYQYQPIRIDEHYNRIIKDIIGNKLVKSRGGRKAPKKPPKVSLKAPKKPPKQPKVSLKAPKKPSKQPKVVLKEPKKPSKQPKVALKAPKKPPKKQPKVALKEPKKPSKVALKAPTVARKTNKNK